MLRGAVFQCQPLPKQLKHLHMLPVSLSVGAAGLESSVSPTPKPPGVDLESLLVFSAQDSR